MPLLPRSSVAKKLLNGVTGCGLFAFILVHLGANLLLLANDPDVFNGWAYFLEGFGPLIRLAEIGLGLFFLLHSVSAVSVYLDKRRARPARYAARGRAGGASRKTLSSTSMIFSGLVLLVFLVWHVLTFRFGPGIEQGYVVVFDGHAARDLHRLTLEFFSDRWNVGIYVALMVFLGFHLRHGFWSMFQSLGAYHPRCTPALYALGAVFGVLLAVGFIAIPLWVYFNPMGMTIGGV